MLTITVPPELAVRLAEEAVRRGTTPELLALEGVRRVVPPDSAPVPPPDPLLSFLAGHVGSVAGSDQPLSQDCGKTFADGLAAGRAARP